MNDQVVADPVQVVEVKIQNLTAENFAPYGQVLSSAMPLFPEVDSGEGRVAIELSRLGANWRRSHLEEMAVHFSYNQTFIMLKGSQILVVAPPPRNRSAPIKDYEIQYDKVAAFVVEAGEGVLINKGVWHNSLTLGPVVYANVTRKDPGEGTTRTPPPGMIPRDREYIGSVDLAKRDGKIIKVVF
jgi:ureidoglycolate hydrolase